MAAHCVSSPSLESESISCNIGLHPYKRDTICKNKKSNDTAAGTKNRDHDEPASYQSV